MPSAPWAAEAPRAPGTPVDVACGRGWRYSRASCYQSLYSQKLRSPVQCKGKAGSSSQAAMVDNCPSLVAWPRGSLGNFPNLVCVTRQPELSVGVNCSLMNDRTQIATLTQSLIFNLCLFSHLFASLACVGNKLCISTESGHSSSWNLIPVRMLVFVISHCGPWEFLWGTGALSQITPLTLLRSKF